MFLAKLVVNEVKNTSSLLNVEVFKGLYLENKITSLKYITAYTITAYSDGILLLIISYQSEIFGGDRS